MCVFNRKGSPQSFAYLNGPSLNNKIVNHQPFYGGISNDTLYLGCGFKLYSHHIPGILHNSSLAFYTSDLVETDLATTPSPIIVKLNPWLRMCLHHSYRFSITKLQNFSNNLSYISLTLDPIHGGCLEPITVGSLEDYSIVKVGMSEYFLVGGRLSFNSMATEYNIAYLRPYTDLMHQDIIHSLFTNQTESRRVYRIYLSKSEKEDEKNWICDRVDSMTQARQWPIVFKMKDSVYVVGGQNHIGFNNQMRDVDICERFDLVNQKWVECPYKFPRSYSHCKGYINSYFHAAVVNDDETIAVFVPTMNDHLPVHKRFIFVFMENIGFFTLSDSSLEWRMYLESCPYANPYFGMIDEDTRFYQRHLAISLS